MTPPTDPKAARNMRELGALVRDKRTSSGLTQAQAAALCNVSTPFLSMLENGKDALRSDKVFAVLNGLGLDIFIGQRGLPRGQ